jgi:hypothetical protein
MDAVTGDLEMDLISAELMEVDGAERRGSVDVSVGQVRVSLNVCFLDTLELNLTLTVLSKLL